MSQAMEPSLYPWFAPLPGPIIDHLLVRLERTKQAAGKDAWQTLFAQLQEKRDTAYFYMDPFIRTAKSEGPKDPNTSFSTGWMLQTLGSYSPDKKPISRRTFSLWYQRGLVKFRRHGLPEYNSAAALFIARMIDSTAERNFLPSKMEPEDQDWWCFTQAHPHAPMVPWRASQLDTLPPSTVCWTPWLGAAWEPGWIMKSNQRIALRWARYDAVARRYTLTPVELSLWDPSCAALIEPEDPDILQALAYVALFRRASAWLSESNNLGGSSAHQERTIDEGLAFAGS